MPNFQKTLRAEIERIARKAIRDQTDALKKSSTGARSEIAALKRRVSELERSLARATKAPGRGTTRDASSSHKTSEAKHRFSASRLAHHRQRLKLSAVEMGLLLGASDQSIRLWESGNVRPRDSVLPAISALRQLSPRSAAAVVAQRRGSGVPHPGSGEEPAHE